MKKLVLIGGSLFIISQPLLAKPVLFDKTAPNVAAHYLGWVPAKNRNICHGYYKEPSIVLRFPNPPNMKTTKVKITAKKPVTFSARGDSVLNGDVTITQPGREIIADKVILHRDHKANKITNADLIGHVRVREYGRLLIGDHAHINFISKTLVVNNAIYRVATTSPTGPVNLWGRARKIVRDKSHVMHLYHATYSTCQPLYCSWHITSQHMRLDKTTGYGTVNNAMLFFQGVPTMFTPYFRFSIDRKRKSGFLYPSFTYSDKSGFTANLPYYLNLAPNYDATITPRIFSRRGVLATGKFRYLTRHSYGQLSGGFIFHDAQFKSFKRQALIDYKPSKTRTRLENSSNNRGMVSYQDITHFNDHWSADANLNYVSDDYYFRDFGNTPAVINNDQLLNQVDLNYASQHWRFLGRLQGFQTLHLLTQPTSADQYYRLPQLDLIGDFPGEKYGIDYHIANEFVYFDHARDYSTGLPVTIGGRFNIQPSISWPHTWSGVFLQPTLQLPITFYQLQQSAKRSVSRVIPIVSVDSGLIFERLTHLFGHAYEQTLEPRLFYLYVPYQDQDNIPIFDTNISDFSFDSLFRANRFSGIDRIGDANQFTLALTSRFIDSDTGDEQMRFSLGQIYALHRHRICVNNLCKLDPLVAKAVSPIIGEVQYNLTPHWSVTGDAAWDVFRHRLNNSGFSLQYAPGKNSVVNVGYHYEVDGDTYNNKTVNLNRVDVGATWALTPNWRLLGDWNYNISSHSPQAYLYGIEYNSCCWALRLVASKLFTGYDDNQHSLFDRRFYVQFMLKGLGSVGTSGASALLASRISGFHDQFEAGAL